MTSVTDLVTDMGSIVGHLEAVPAKLQHFKLRPSCHEVGQLYELAANILQHAQALQRKLDDCATEWTPEVYQKADECMLRARPAVEAISQGQIKGPILRRNLIAIFQGRQPSTIDSQQVKARKAKRTQRCQMLRGLGPAVVLAWGVSVPPSAWEEMDQRVFNDLVRQMTKEAVTDLPSNIRKTLTELGREEPFRSIATYCEFVRGESPRVDLGLDCDEGKTRLRQLRRGSVQTSRNLQVHHMTSRKSEGLTRMAVPWDKR